VIEAKTAGTERADKLFGALSPGELEHEVAPGKNRLIYLWGHLAAVNDALFPLLGTKRIAFLLNTFLVVCAKSSTALSMLFIGMYPSS